MTERLDWDWEWELYGHHANGRTECRRYRATVSESSGRLYWRTYRTYKDEEAGEVVAKGRLDSWRGLVEAVPYCEAFAALDVLGGPSTGR